MAEEDLDLDVETEGEGSGRGGGLKIVLIVVFGVLLVSSSLMAVLYFTGFFTGGEEQETAAAEAGAADEAATPAETKAKRDLSGPVIYQPLEPPFVVNFNNQDTNVRFMQITIQVADRDRSVIEDVKTHSPAIRNSLVMLFGSQDPEVLNTRGGKEALRKEALNEVRSVLKEMTGEGELENLYFTSFVMQ